MQTSKSSESFAYDAGFEDGRGGHPENVSGFSEDLRMYYLRGFQQGRSELRASVRVLFQRLGKEAFENFVYE